MPASGHYKIRKLRKSDGTGPEATSLGLPIEIARMMPDNVRFTVELTEDGILYRPTKTDVTPSEIPDWVSELGGGATENPSGNGGSTTAPKRTAKAAAASS